LARVVSHASARIGLLGNPADVYGGKVLAITVPELRARVTLESADRFEIHADAPDTAEFESLLELTHALRRGGPYGAGRLLRAALLRFSAHWPELESLAPDDPRLRMSMRCDTEVPRQVGLAGSSAIVIAALRALAAWFEVEIAPADLARLALDAETRDLGITAGPMDRVVQALEGLWVLDFARPDGDPRPLDPILLPPRLLVWDPEPGEVSGRVHQNVRTRWESGDPEVRETIAELKEVADAGITCLETGDVEGFRRRVDRNFDLRARIWQLRPRDTAQIEIARACGAAAKFCGSGGAAVAFPARAQELAALEAAYTRAGYRTLRPEREVGTA